jgi:hypothetical protein
MNVCKDRDSHEGQRLLKYRLILAQSLKAHTTQVAERVPRPLFVR